MAYIKWKEYISNGNIKPVPDLPPGHVWWSDRVTGTRYCIEPHDYENWIEKIKGGVKGKDAGEIVKFLDEQLFIETFPFRFPMGDLACTFREAARLYVLFAYLIYKPSEDEKEGFRKSAYHAFIRNEKEKYDEAWNALKEMLGEGNRSIAELHVTVLKGCAYKIKKYYLENNEIKDIRGASMLLTYVGEELIPGTIGKRFIEECVIYSGGGSLLCILPAWADEKLWFEAETMFHRYTLSVNTAFYQERMELRELLYNYADMVQRMEQGVDRRKSIKIYNSTCPSSPYFKSGRLPIGGQEVPLEAVEINEDKCRLCGVRKAKYRLKTGDGKEVCGSCLHKHFAGKSGKNSYFNDYEDYVNKSLGMRPDSLDDMADSNKYIAVVYGDGNNMGAIMHEMNRLDAVMYFSRRTSQAAKRATYKALQSTYGGSLEGRFEIIALGGDDIFLFVPAKGAIEFAAMLVEFFNTEFKNLSAYGSESQYSATLSAGICIGKSKTPVRVMFDSAEEAMHRAKAFARKNMESNCDTGSIDFTVLQSSVENSSESRDRNYEDVQVRNTLLPYSLETACGIIQLLGKLQDRGSKISKSNLFRIMNSIGSAESVMEGRLFYCYDQARNKNRLEKILRDNPVAEYTPDSGFFRDKERKLCFPWKDLLNLWDFYGRD